MLNEAPKAPVSGNGLSSSPAHDPLLECLLVLAQAHAIPTSRDALLSGLPLENHRLTPSLFERAAKRIGLASKIVHRSLDQIEDALLPVVLLLKDQSACVLVAWEPDRNHCQVIFPELGEAAVTLAKTAIEARYFGEAIFSRPRFRFDRRAPETGRVRQRHWFWGALAENIPLYRDVLVAAGLINVFALFLPLFSMNVYDRVVPNQAEETLWMLSVGLIIVLSADLGLRLMRGYFIDLAGSRVDVNLSAHIMERVLGIRMENRPLSAGSFASNLRSFETVRDFITSATVMTVIDLPFAILFIVVMGWIDWPMMLPGIVGVILIISYALLVQGKMHDLSETTYRAGAQRNANLVESLVGLETIKAVGAEGIMQRKWERSTVFLSRVSNQLRLLAATTVNSAMFVQQLVYLSLIIIGVYRIGANELTMGGLIACSMLSSRIMAPFGQLASLLTQFHNASTALTTLNQIMANPVERPDDANFVSRQHLLGEIEFKDVSFAYPGQDVEALRGVTLHIHPGEHVGILGRVGSGKTTLQKLLLGLYQPKTGSIRLDGVDIRQLDPAELRRNVGYVSQDATLFFGTLKENILLASPLMDDAALVQAADVAGLLDYVNSHPRGFDMEIGERGESVSGGQKQCISIARAVIGNPPILLLDEPTGSMDHSTEESVKRKLKEYAAHKTMLIVTHRTALLDLVSRIIVIDNGKIVADGPKASVVEALKQGRIGRAS
ncbi:MAG: type I secretion system permease/ATPase [Hydrogenophilales bacterium]|nr:type I secretion system permease/ATPase [Hydrogenophilales bacterium]